MQLIAIVSKNEDKVREYIKLNEKLNMDNVFFINDKSMNNVKNIKFEIILILDDKYDIENEGVLQKIILNSKYLIIQSEIQDKLNFIEEKSINVITFGFNHKSTVTASSTELENMMLCIQRSIKSVKGKIIEPQEILVNTNSEDINMIMGIAILGILYDL